MYGQYALSVNPNQLIQQRTDSNDFSSALPPRLAGLLTPQEYTEAITRINDAKRPGWAKWLTWICVMGGIAIWVTIIFTSVSNGGGLTPLFGGMGAMVGLWVLGVVVNVVDRRRRIARAQAVVAELHASYTAPGRPAPISWSMSAEAIWFAGRRWGLLCTLRIEVGGAAAIQFPVAVGVVPYPMQYGAAPPQPFGMAGQQPGYGVPGQPQYGAPVFNGAAGMAHPYAQPLPPQHFAQLPQPQAPLPASTDEGEGQQLPESEQLRAPLLSFSPGAAAYGGVAPVASAPGGAVPPAACCEQCGRAAATAQDRFCSACGGAIRRPW